MLVQACNQLEYAISETSNTLDQIQDSYKDQLSQTYPPGINPILLLKRIEVAKDRIIKQIEQKQLLEEQKLTICTTLNEQIAENKRLLEKLLSITEFSGDYDVMEQFQEVASMVVNKD